MRGPWQNAQADEQSGNDATEQLHCIESECSINFDNYPETSWAVMDGSTTLASGGTAPASRDGSTLNIGLCLPDGCFIYITMLMAMESAADMEMDSILTDDTRKHACFWRSIQ